MDNEKRNSGANMIKRKFGVDYVGYLFLLPFIVYLIVWKILMWMLEEGGLLNHYLEASGFSPLHWLSTPTWAMVSIIMMSAWRLVGYNTIIFFVGLQNIPDIYYEAAEIDGATALKNFWHITIPLVRPM